METIYFYSKKEAISFCEQLFRDENEINIQWKTDKNWGNKIYFVEQNTDLETLIYCFIEVFIKFRLHQSIESVVKYDYFFSNVEEVERIIEITKWIINKLATGNFLNLERVKLETKLYNIFKMNIKHKRTVHFDSVVKFRMNTLHQLLINIVGLAIDEFKREEEYQNFIHSIREYITNQKPKQNELYVVQNNPFLFYKKNGQQYTTDELKKIMKKEPLYMIGLDESEPNLAPLIALMPKHIYIYGDDVSEAKTLSVINIFQERVTFHSSYKFPFQP